MTTSTAKPASSEAKQEPKSGSQEPTGADIAQAIQGWSKHLVENKAKAQECAVMALEHCFKHRDAVYLHKMLEVISEQGQDYVRKTPYLHWCHKYAPVKMVDSIIVFDKDSKLTVGVLPEAKATLWWRTVPEAVVNPFTPLNVISAALSAVKKFENAEKYEDTGNGMAEVAKIKKFLENEKAVAEAQVANA